MTADPENAPKSPAEESPERSPLKRRLVLVLTACLAGAAVGLAGVYGIAAFQRNPNEAACPGTAEIARRVAPHARGEVAAVAAASEPKRLPELAFTDADGKPRTLADWRGKTVLLNLWATWCVPCRKEMPALDELQAKLGGEGFEVVAVNIDTRNPDKPRAWLKDVGVNRLAYYADPSAKIFQELKSIGKAFGMPTTLLIDPQGCEIAALAGPAEWASEDALKLVQAALGK
jgi:thiol-disulfide isomerase/thioredoxin